MDELDGATQSAEPNVTSTPAQFAAYWNSQTDQARAQWLAHVRANSEIAMTCFMQQHERIDEFRGALIRVLQLLSRHEGEQREPGRVLIPVEQIRAAIEGRS